MKNKLINMLWMQALWFAAIFGASHEKTWPCVVVALSFAGWQLSDKHKSQGDAVLVGIAVMIGLLLDSFWVQVQWLDYQEPWPFPEFAPLWILALWVGFALTINHSLGWLQGKTMLAAIFSGSFSVLSYIAAQRLGAVAVIAEPNMVYPAIFISWAVILPLLQTFANHFRTHYIEAKP